MKKYGSVGPKTEGKKRETYEEVKAREYIPN